MLSSLPYRATGTGVLRGVDDINVILDEQIAMTQTVMFSAFKGQNRGMEQITLLRVSEILELWVIVQRSWLYLQPVFESPDTNHQLSTEGKKFQTVDKNWRNTISNAKHSAKVIDFCHSESYWKELKKVRFCWSTCWKRAF